MKDVPEKVERYEGVSADEQGDGGELCRVPHELHIEINGHLCILFLAVSCMF